MIAVIATVLANLLTNLSATLLLVPLLAPLGTPAVLAALLGLNIGSGLTLHRVAGQPAVAPQPGPARATRPACASFHRVSLVATPLGPARRGQRARARHLTAADADDPSRFHRICGMIAA